MLSLNEQDIKRIVNELDCGFRCFIHRETGELITVPDELKYPGIDTETWVEEQQKLETDFTSFFEIEPLQSSDGFEMKVDFTKLLLGNDKLKSQLLKALNNKHPFRNFKFIIDNSGPYRRQWFEFKNLKLIELVKDELNRNRLWLDENSGN